MISSREPLGSGWNFGDLVENSDCVCPCRQNSSEKPLLAASLLLELETGATSKPPLQPGIVVAAAPAGAVAVVDDAVGADSMQNAAELGLRVRGATRQTDRQRDKQAGRKRGLPNETGPRDGTDGAADGYREERVGIENGDGWTPGRTDGWRWRGKGEVQPAVKDYIAG